MNSGFRFEFNLKRVKVLEEFIDRKRQIAKNIIIYNKLNAFFFIQAIKIYLKKQIKTIISSLFHNSEFR